MQFSFACTFILVFLCCSLSTINSEIFTSLSRMEKMFEAEHQISDLLYEYIDVEKQRLNELEKFVAEVKHNTELASRDPLAILGNPVSAFLLLKRFSYDWDTKYKHLLSSEHSEEARTLRKHIEQTKDAYMPTEEDFEGSADALLRLQDTYQISSTDIANGNLPGVAFSPVMSARDCYDLGRAAYAKEDFYHSTIWFSEALNRLNNEMSEASTENATTSVSTLQQQVDLIELLDYLSFSLYKQGNILHASRYTDELLQRDPTNSRASSNKKYFDNVLYEAARQKGQSLDDYKQGYLPAPELRPELVKDQYRISEEFTTYEALCRGENLIPNPYTHQLKCRYVHNFHPRLILAPVREEEVYLSPRIVILKEFINDYEIKTLQELSRPLLKRATIIDPETGVQKPAFYRVSQSGWLSDDKHPVVEYLSNRMSAYSNITLETVEELQVQNYGLGGQYEPHYDFARPEETQAFDQFRGNRISTFLIYMTTVEAGGGTVFTKLGVRAIPVKGDTVFWWNLLKDGTGNFATRHAGCPVLVGNKWVANKWFHHHGNHLTLPCSCEELEQFSGADFPQTRSEQKKGRPICSSSSMM